MADTTDYKALFEKTKKSLDDTKAAYTKSRQATATLEAELKVVTDLGIQAPKDILSLKTEKPEEYTAKLAAFNDSVINKRKEAALLASNNLKISLLTSAITEAGLKLTPDELKDSIPPNIYSKYTNQDISPDKLVQLAIQYNSKDKSVQSPTTSADYDFSGVAGGLDTTVADKVDKTLDKKNYIL